MSGFRGMDLVDAITEWSHRGNEELNEDDIDAILRIQLAIDSSAWSRVDIVTLSSRDIAAIKAELHDVDAPDFTAWVIDETLAELGVQPMPGLNPPGAFEAAAGTLAATDTAADDEDELARSWTTESPETAEMDELAELGEVVDTAEVADTIAPERPVVARLHDPWAELDLEVDEEDAEADECGEGDIEDEADPPDAEIDDEPETEDDPVDDETGDDETEGLSDDEDAADGDDTEDEADDDTEDEADDDDTAADDAAADDDTDEDDDTDDDTDEDDDTDDDADEADDDTADDDEDDGEDDEADDDEDDGEDDEDDGEDDEAEDEDDDEDDDDEDDEDDDEDDEADDDEDAADGDDTEDETDDDTDEDDDETDEDEESSGGRAFAFAASAEGDAELEKDTDGWVSTASLELREGPDTLGPTFLNPTRRTRSTWVVLAVVSVAAIAAFIVFGLQLVDDINNPDTDDEAEIELVDAEDEGADTADTEGDTDDDTAAEDDNEAEGDADDPEPDNDNDADAQSGDDTAATDEDDAEPGDDDADDEQGDDDADDPAADTEDDPDQAAALPAAENSAIVVTDAGEVVLIDLLLESTGDPQLLFGGPEGRPATDVTVVDGGLAVVTENGDVDYVPFDDPDDATTIWAADDLGPAVEATDFGERYIVLEATGSISVFPKSQPANEDSIDRVWDTSAGGTPPAREMDRFVDLVPFVAGNGDVELLVLSGDEPSVVPIWSGASQPPAYNLEITEDGVLLGVGTGGIARYSWLDAQALTAVWDPFDGSRLPAIAYAAADDATAIVLNNGSVALIDETGSGPILWDAEVSDLRAIDVKISPTEALLVLDGGTVLRIDPSGSNDSRGSVWDVTDEALSPAVQVLLLSR